MKKYFAFIILLFIFTILISACSPEETTSTASEIESGGESNINNSSTVDDTSRGDNSETSNNNDWQNVTVIEYERYYPDELYDIKILSQIISQDKIDEYTETVFLKQNAYTSAQIPVIYQYINGLSINKEDFIRANSKKNDGANIPVYKDEQIEMMFGNNDEKMIMKTLHLGTSFYCDGKLYNIYELSEMNEKAIETISAKKELFEYLDMMKKKVRNKTDLVKKINNVLDIINNIYFAEINTAENFERYYPDEMYEIYILSKIKTWDEIEEYTENIFLKQDAFTTNQMPIIYQYIKGLAISKDEFIRANNDWKIYSHQYGVKQSVYTDEQIEILFGDYDVEFVMDILKKDSTFYHSGRLYNINEIINLGKAEINNLCETRALFDYLNLMKAKAENNNELVKDINNTLNKIDKEFTIDDGNGYGWELEKYELYYPDALYDLTILGEITEFDKISKYIEEEYKIKYFGKSPQLPTIYDCIKKFNIKKENFVRANNARIDYNKNNNFKKTVYTDKQIEILFGNYSDEKIKKELKADTAFYYNGKLYNIYEINRMDASELKAINVNNGLLEYLDMMKTKANNQSSLSLLIDNINNTLNKTKN